MGTNALDRLFAALGTAGIQARAVPVRRVDDLRREWESLYARSLIDPRLDEVYLRGCLDFSVAERDPALRSIVIAASPSPQARLVFRRGGRALAVRLGPIMADRIEILETVKRISAEVLAPEGFRTAPVVLPKKSLAVHGGLARYGRNNLAFVPEMGTFHRLTAFATDAPCPGDPWQELEQLERCDRCSACARRCPTGAIEEDRFVLRAERCLAFFNEKPPEFPAWLEPGWHHCVIGCMTCQLLCPENRAVRGRFEDRGEFSEEETLLLLEPRPAEELPGDLVAKLRRAGLLPYLAVLPRNLRALLENVERGAVRPFEA